MRQASKRVLRWSAFAAIALALTACGGGGGGAAPADPAPAAPADARNGTYTMVAANAREYALTVDFDAKSYRVNGNGVDQTGTFKADGSEYTFAPGNATGATGVDTTRFRYVNDTLVGAYATPDGVLPFIAPRLFVTAAADATGVYNFIGRTVDTTGAPANNTVQQAEITADGHLRTCDDAQIYTIAACPAASVTSGTLTVAGDTFSSATPNGTFTFHVAKVGSDKVFLRASASSGTTRRFIVGLPETTFAAGSFVGGTSEPAWGTASLGTGTVSTTGTRPDGSTNTMTGNVAAVPSIGNLLVVTTASSGNFFASRSGDIGILFAARNNAFAPGYVAIGVKQ